MENKIFNCNYYIKLILQVNNTSNIWQRFYENILSTGIAQYSNSCLIIHQKGVTFLCVGAKSSGVKVSCSTLFLHNQNALELKYSAVPLYSSWSLLESLVEIKESMVVHFFFPIIIIIFHLKRSYLQNLQRSDQISRGLECLRMNKMTSEWMYPSHPQWVQPSPCLSSCSFSKPLPFGRRVFLSLGLLPDCLLRVPIHSISLLLTDSKI